MASGIQRRGPGQFRVQIRLKGKYVSRTFKTLGQAEEWQRIVEGKISGDEYVDLKLAREVSLARACAWMIEGRHFGPERNARNIVAKLRYWMKSPLADWSIAAIHDWDLIQWRKSVLDSDNAPPGHLAGPGAACSPQTAIHRLNALSKLITTWARAHKVPLENPVRPGVRPPRPHGRDRRLLPAEETRLLAEAARSSRPWMQQAIVIAIETGIRQAELTELVWSRVNLNASRPYLELPRTKNDRPRRVPLSQRAVSAFRALRRTEDRAEQAGRVLPVKTTRGVIHAFRSVVGGGAFADLRWHDLRHEAISRLFELTDLRDNEVMAMTGHLTPAMLTRYTHLRTDRLADRLPGGRLNTQTMAL